MSDLYRVMPYNIMGVTLYAVECGDGYIEKYCDTRIDAQEYVDDMNEPTKQGQALEDE